MTKETKQEVESFDLVLEGGEKITVIFPLDILEELYEELHEAQSRDEFWNVANWTNARAMYKGVLIDMVNMKRVIGIA